MDQADSQCGDCARACCRVCPGDYYNDYYDYNDYNDHRDHQIGRR